MSLVSEVKFLSENLNGNELTSVTFVHDYMQFHFQNKVLNFYIWPDIYIDGRYYKFSTKEYSDKICERIGSHIQSIIEKEDLICIEFDDQTQFEIDLKSEHRAGSESLLFSDGDSLEWTVI